MVETESQDGASTISSSLNSAERWPNKNSWNWINQSYKLLNSIKIFSWIFTTRWRYNVVEIELQTIKFHQDI